MYVCLDVCNRIFVVMRSVVQESVIIHVDKKSVFQYASEVSFIYSMPWSVVPFGSDWMVKDAIDQIVCIVPYEPVARYIAALHQG